jgi:RimJ/RimL family protein N-acetyltransferase
MITCVLRSHPAVELTGRKVRLRGIDPADHQRLIRFDRGADRVPRYGRYQHWAAHRASVAEIDGTEIDDAQFAIETLHTRMLVGSMWTVQTDAHARRFSYGIGIGPQHRRCGYASDAITTLLAHMFGERRYRTCEVGIHVRNVASRTLHGRLGFHEESRQRDIVRMSLAAHRFAELHPHLTAAGLARPGRGRHWRPRRGQHWNPGHLR